MTDLKTFTRDLARQIESGLDRRLDWVTIDHWNTDNPHVHLLVRGIDDLGGRELADDARGPRAL